MATKNRFVIATCKRSLVERRISIRRALKEFFECPNIGNSQEVKSLLDSYRSDVADLEREQEIRSRQ